MLVPKITQLPTPPNRQAPSGEFSERADAFLSALLGFGNEANALAQFVNDVSGPSKTAGPNADRAETAAQTAQAAAAAAGQSAGFPSIAGRARRPLAVNDAGTGVAYLDRISIASYIDRSVRVPAATGAVSLNLLVAGVFDLTLTGNTTLSLAGLPSLLNEELSIVVRIRQGNASKALVWWAGITWIGRPVPIDLPANTIAEYVLSFDGVAWLGREGAGT